MFVEEVKVEVMEGVAGEEVVDLPGEEVMGVWLAGDLLEGGLGLEGDGVAGEFGDASEEGGVEFCGRMSERVERGGVVGVVKG